MGNIATINNVWDTEIKMKLKEFVSVPSYDTWIKDIEFQGLQEDTLYLKAANQFATDWIKNRYGAEILELANLFGINTIKWIDTEEIGSPGVEQMTIELTGSYELVEKFIQERLQDFQETALIRYYDNGRDKKPTREKVTLKFVKQETGTI